jgi:hypothetical protein
MRVLSAKESKDMNGKRWTDIEFRHDWKLFQEMHDQGLSFGAIRKKMKMAYSTIQKAKKLGLIEEHEVFRPKMTEVSKKKISEKRKQWLKANPEKHPWRSKDKFQSEPCKKAKEFLISFGVSFIEEFNPEIDGRFFSIDIALPDKMIALEINGNQHYEKDGKLKPYYQERHDLLESCGWTVYEIHYSSCFMLEKWADFIELLKSSERKVDFDYFNHVPKLEKTKKFLCLDCLKEIFQGSKRCIPCSSIARSVKLPNEEELQKMLWEIPSSELAKQFGLSHTALGKRVKKMGLTKPERGYWIKKRGS